MCEYTIYKSITYCSLKVNEVLVLLSLQAKFAKLTKRILQSGLSHTQSECYTNQSQL